MCIADVVSAPAREGHHQVGIAQVVQTCCDSAMCLDGFLEGQDPWADRSLVR
jgi:hypothetical protein